MTKSPRSPTHFILPLKGMALALSAALLLGACVVSTPPPPRVYAPPPPPPPPPPAQTYDAPSADVEVQASEPPPPLPDYQQPPCPEEGYLWTPGYWAWGGGGYYWVPGTWVQPPRVGVLWTPGYWGFVGGVYAFHAGYWGPHVGFYGGVNYGFGYGGVGFAGGRWAGNSFAYNRSVTNVTVTNVHNTYNETVINNVSVTKVSYNGGAGGVAAAPTAQERVAAREQHVAPTPLQREHFQEAAKNPALAARANGGHPAIAATPKPAAFNAPGVIGARGAAPLPPHPAGVQGQGAPRINNVTNEPHPAVNPALNPAVHPGVNPAAQNGGHPPVNATAPNGVHPQVAGAKPPPPKAPPAKPVGKQKPQPRNEKHEPENK
jgi:hypothetical protein